MAASTKDPEHKMSAGTADQNLMSALLNNTSSTNHLLEASAQEDILSMTNENKISILEMIQNTHRQEITHHREMQFRTFSWASSLLLAAIGGLVIIGAKWAQYYLVGNIALTIMTVIMNVILFLLFRRSRTALESNARTVVRVDIKLGLYDEGCYGGSDAIYPKQWLDWGSNNRSASIETGFYSVIVIILSIVLIATGWFLI